jgi:hypothetical protein
VTIKLARVIALTVVPLTLTAVACSSSGGSSGSTTPPAATTPPASPSVAAACAVTPSTAAQPPSKLPTPTDAQFYEKTPVGSTTDYFAYAPGHDVKQRRDAIKTQLSGAGFDIKGTDAEDNEEAELEFEGNGFEESSVQVIPRSGCETQVRIRYRVRG